MKYRFIVISVLVWILVSAVSCTSAGAGDKKQEFYYYRAVVQSVQNNEDSGSSVGGTGQVIAVK